MKLINPINLTIELGLPEGEKESIGGLLRTIGALVVDGYGNIQLKR